MAYKMDDKKIEINIYLSKSQHAELKNLRQLGLNMSSLSRIALKKYQCTSLDNESTPDIGGLKRVQLYLDERSSELVSSIAINHGINRSETLRRVLARYLRDHVELIRQLF